MRLPLLSFATLALLAMASCKPPPKDVATKAFVKELHLYFNNLNNEAQSRKEDLRKADARLGLMTATGAIYSTYTWDETAFVVKNFKCKNCETKLILTSPTTDYLCPSCGRSPYEVFKKEATYKSSLGPDGRPKEPSATAIAKESFERDGAQALSMFDLTKENTAKPLIATVRYVRRQ